jgi:TatD DNase family protein
MFYQNDIMNFFNFHTHNTSETSGIISLSEYANFTEGKKYSVGLHPWYYDKNSIHKMSEIAKAAENPQVVAIGETGFDKKSGLDLAGQTEIFEAHVALSEKLQKPLIIHCVKQFQHLIAEKKKLQPTQPWILHGFCGKLSQVSPLIQSGIYFSISHSLLSKDKKSSKFFSFVPKERLFFETDDGNFPVENVYKSATRWMNISLEELCEIIDKNLKTINL